MMYYDEDGYPVSTRPNGLLKLLTCLSVIGLACIAFLTYWPQIAAHLPVMQSPVIVIATAAPNTGSAPRAPLPASQPRPTALPIVNIGGSYNNQAAADAAYATAVAAGAQQPATSPIPNQNNTGDSAPIETGERLSVREHNVENAPTAEPIVLSSDDQTGEKIKPVNIQETHQCLHGQVWVTDRGCKNPTPVR